MIVFISLLRLVLRILFAVVVLFPLTNIKKVIKNINIYVELWIEHFKKVNLLLSYSTINTSLCFIVTL